jgi:hypothetical protein
MLVVEVFERINKRESLGQQHEPKVKHKVVTDLEVMLKNQTKLGRLERFHDALQKKEEAFSLFNLGYLDLENRAAAESLFWQICEQIAKEASEPATSPRNSASLDKLLADQYVCNFSVFQSLLDHWASTSSSHRADPPAEREADRQRDPRRHHVRLRRQDRPLHRPAGRARLHHPAPAEPQALLPRHLPHRSLPGHHGRPPQPLRPCERGPRVPRRR